VDDDVIRTRATRFICAWATIEALEMPPWHCDYIAMRVHR